MTKKFWADWQRKIGETKQVWYEEESECGHYKWDTYLLNDYDGDKIIKANFHGDVVDLVIERHNRILKNWQIHIHIENEYKTLHRNEIKTIEFIKYE